ncbi:hypothetical protein ACFY0N_36765 [Streptomyces vinaceus]|uniref:hypothetical protein n=1 Tax=Streptomyces vinaceus TaxID=1960 RepID=UPI0036990AD5
MSVDPSIRCWLRLELVPLSTDVFALEAEWQRRFPDMVGTLVCRPSAVGTTWCCTTGSAFVAGHIPASGLPCADAWSHLSQPGTHHVMVMRYPRSSLLQGDGPYLRRLGNHPDSDPGVHAALCPVLQDQAARSTASARQKPERSCRSWKNRSR